MSVKVMRLMPAITANVEMQKNQKEKSRTKFPEIVPRILTT